jgi:hypothetical protein
MDKSVSPGSGGGRVHVRILDADWVIAGLLNRLPQFRRDRRGSPTWVAQ